MNNKNIFLLLEFDYNIGALKVLKLLKDADILNLTEYLGNISNEADVQGIIGDMIDCDDPQMQDLLVEVVMGSKSSEVINLQFKECFRQYVDDVVNRSELIKNEFITTIEQRLPPDIYRDFIILQLVNGLLAIELQNITDIKQVFKCQKEWNCQFSNNKLSLLSRILHHIASNHSETLAKLLINKLQTNADLNYLFALFILNHIDQKSKGMEELKSKLCNYSCLLIKLLKIFLSFRIS